MTESSRTAIEEISIAEQIKEVEREIAIRKNVYARRITQGQMTRETAEKLMTRMRAVLAHVAAERELRATARDDNAGLADGPRPALPEAGNRHRRRQNTVDSPCNADCR